MISIPINIPIQTLQKKWCITVNGRVLYIHDAKICCNFDKFEKSCLCLLWHWGIVLTVIRFDLDVLL